MAVSVRDIMGTGVPPVRETDLIERVLHALPETLPVVERGRQAGVVTRPDVPAALVEA